jgi:hypothetical protein
VREVFFVARGQVLFVAQRHGLSMATEGPRPQRSRPFAFGSIFGIDLGSLIYFWNKEKRLDEQ